MTERRVLHIIDRLGTGGAEHLLLTAAERADSQGWDMQVVTLTDSTGLPVHDRLIELGVTPRTLDSSRSRTLSDPRRLRQLRRTVKQLDPDIVHTHLRYSNILGPIASAGLRVPRVATLHTIAGSPGGAEPRDRLERSALRHGFDARIAVGPTVGTSQQRRIGRDVVVVPNPVDVSAQHDISDIAMRRCELLAGEEGPLLLTAGRLTEAKGLPDLIRAFVLVLHYFPGAVLAIAGGGELLGELKLLAVASRVDAHVRFLGIRTDLPLLMRATDVFVLTSVHEGLPLVLLEAMAASRPIVATNVGDVAFALDGAGLLVAPRQHCQIASGAIRLLSDPWLARRLGDQARVTVSTRNAPEEWASSLDDVYASVGRRSHA